MFDMRNVFPLSYLKKKKISYKQARYLTELKGKKCSHIPQGTGTEDWKIVSDWGNTWDIFPFPETYPLLQYSFTIVVNFCYLYVFTSFCWIAFLTPVLYGTSCTVARFSKQNYSRPVFYLAALKSCQSRALISWVWLTHNPELIYKTLCFLIQKAGGLI